MSAEGTSYRQILRSTSIIGGASVVNILIGLVRVKVAAVLLGPAGIGLMGLFSNLISTASNVAALGTGTVGTRQIAEAAGRNDQQAVAAARRAMFWCTLVLATVGTVVFWLLRGTLAARVLNDPSLSPDVGWLALGVGLGVAGGSQAALLNGLRRIGDLARVSVYSAAIATVLGVAALVLWRERGLLIYLLLTPVASFVVGHWYVARLPEIEARSTALRDMTHHWVMLVRLGTAFMVAGLVVTVGQLLVRTLVQRELGAASLGHFEAAWVISMTYMGFVLRAMGTDYYPRLTAAIHDHAAINTLVNEQTEVALLLAGPVFLTMLGLAPWVIETLYSTKFGEAAAVLRWQVLGDILKVASWPLGYVILAAGRGKTVLVTETMAMFVFALFVWLALPYIGLISTGVAFLLMYVVYLPVVYLIVKRQTGFSWTKSVLARIVFLFAAGAAVAMLAGFHAVWGALFGVVTACGFAIHAVGQLARMGALPASLSNPAHRYRKLLLKLGLVRD